MSRNVLYLVIGALVVAVIGFGIYAYRQETEPQGVEIEFGEGGVSIEGN